mgnify:CR=1 FL=1
MKDPDNLYHGIDDFPYISFIGHRIFIFKIIRDNTEIYNISKIIFPFFCKSNLEFKSTFRIKIISFSTDLFRFFYRVNKRFLVIILS